MTENLNPQHQAEATRWSDYIRARVKAGIASAALNLAEWVGEKTEYEERDEDE